MWGVCTVAAKRAGFPQLDPQGVSEHLSALSVYLPVWGQLWYCVMACVCTLCITMFERTNLYVQIG